MKTLLLYAGALFIAVWGVAHLVPTRSVVNGFGNLSDDNRRIVTMEWIVEGVFLVFIGVIIAAVTVVDAELAVSKIVYWLVFIVLNALTVVSLFTGFRIRFLPFKLCPLIFTTTALLVWFGGCL